MFGFKLKKDNFSDEDFLLQSIQLGEAKAIIFLQDKATGFARKMLEQRQLPQHILGEVLNDATIVLVKKTRALGFSLETAKISTYFNEIIKYVILNKTRARQYTASHHIDDFQHLTDTDVQEYASRKEAIETIDQLLGAIGAPCADIIRLKYLDGFSDEEVIDKKLSTYMTVESLR